MSHNNHNNWRMNNEYNNMKKYVFADMSYAMQNVDFNKIDQMKLST